MQPTKDYDETTQSIFQLDTLEFGDIPLPVLAISHSFFTLEVTSKQLPGYPAVTRNSTCAKSILLRVTRGLGDTIWHCKTSCSFRFSASEAIKPGKSSSSVTAPHITPKLEQMETRVKKRTTLAHSQQELTDSTATPFTVKCVILTTRKVQINTTYWQTRAAQIAFSSKTVYVAQHNADWHHCSWHSRERGKKQAHFVPSRPARIQYINKPDWGVRTSIEQAFGPVVLYLQHQANKEVGNVLASVLHCSRSISSVKREISPWKMQTARVTPMPVGMTAGQWGHPAVVKAAPQAL